MIQFLAMIPSHITLLLISLVSFKLKVLEIPGLDLIRQNVKMTLCESVFVTVTLFVYLTMLLLRFFSTLQKV